MRAGAGPGEPPAALEAKGAGAGDRELRGMFGIAMGLAVADADRPVAIDLNGEADHAVVLLHEIIAECVIELERVPDMVLRTKIEPSGKLREILHHRTSYSTALASMLKNSSPRSRMRSK